MSDSERVTDSSVRISGPKASYQIAFENDDHEATENYEDNLGQLCLKWAAGHPEAVATVVLKHDITCDLPRFANWSFWMTVIGNKKLAHYLIESTRTLFKNVEARAEGAIGDGATPRIHVRDGQVWKPFEAGYWEAITPEALVIPATIDVSESAFDDEEFESDKAPPPTSTRTPRSRAVRGDARIASVILKVEQAYGLPAGSVRLVKPDGNPLRADAFVRTLREHWE